MRLALDARKLTDFGIGTYVSHLIEGVALQEDIALTLLVRPGHEERALRLAPQARLIAVSAPGYSVLEHLQLPWVLSKQRPDLVHFPHYVMPPLVGIPSVVTVHDIIQLFYLPRQSTLSMWYLRLMMRLALRRGRRVITVSRASRDDLVSLFGADPSRLVVIPNGVRAELASRPASEVIDELKQRYGLRPPLVLTVGNDKPHKNLDVVLRVWALAVRRHRVPGQLVLVGGPEARSQLARRAEQLGLGERTRFLGRIPQSDLEGLYHVAAVLLHVALYEGFGLPILEAMQAGLPVIASNLGAMRELGEGSARLVNPLDVGEMAAVLERVLVDDPLRRRMVEAGRKKAQSLTWEATVAATTQVYRQIVGEV